MSNEEYKGKYEHYFRPVAPDPNWPHGYQFILVDRLDDLCEVIRQYLVTPQERRVLAFDTETSSLNPEEGEIVGCSFCFDPLRAFYVPTAHKVGRNIEREAVPYIERMLYAAAVVPMYHARFDLRYVKWQGWNVDRIPYFDVMIPTWLTDTNVADPDLKTSSKRFLGWDMTKYETAVGASVDLSYQDPRDVTPYAAADALSTFHLGKRLGPFIKEYKTPCELDNRVILPVMLMEDTPHPISRKTLNDLLQEVTLERQKTEKEVYSLVGGVFNIGSTRQVEEVLRRLGLDTGDRTPTGQMKTDDESLEKIADQSPVCEKILEYRRLEKLLGTFIENLLNGYIEHLGGNRFGYRLTRVPTGRLAAAGDKKNSYFTKGLNIQAVKKALPMLYEAERSDGPGSVLGWRFVPTDKKGPGLVEGLDPRLSVRRAFKAFPGHLYAHFDFRAQELRIPANLSGEPFLVQCFLEDRDLHREMAAFIWGEALALIMRKNAKFLNFGALFGGSKYTFARNIGCSLEEAQIYLSKWWERMAVLDAWRHGCFREARKSGTVHTYLHRPRRVAYYYAQKSRGMQGFADRTVINTQVQGAAADLIKIALVSIYDSVLKPEVETKRVRLLSTVHDELNFSVLQDIGFFTPTVLKLWDLMKVKLPGWKVPMDVELSVGHSWGEVYPFTYEEGKGFAPIRTTK